MCVPLLRTSPPLPPVPAVGTGDAGGGEQLRTRSQTPLGMGWDQTDPLSQ